METLQLPLLALPQIGFIIPISKEYQGYLNIKGYKDLEVENRANTWSTWVTFAVSPAPPEPARNGSAFIKR